MSDLKLKLNVFEGPLDLLLHLIEKDKIDIYDPDLTFKGLKIIYDKNRA